MWRSKPETVEGNSSRRWHPEGGWSLTSSDHSEFVGRYGWSECCEFSEFFSSHEVVSNDMLLINRLNDAIYVAMTWLLHYCCYLSYSSVYSLTSLVLAGAIFVHFPFSKPGEFPFAATGSPVCRDDGPRSQAALILLFCYDMDMS